MQFATRWLAVGASASILCPLAGATAATHSAAATDHHQSRRTVVSFLAGSKRYLVYGLGYEYGENERVSTKSEYLWIRTRSGETRNLGRAPKLLDSPSMSIIDGTLYGMTGDDINHPTPQVVHWWSLRRHTEGHARLPHRLSYVTGAPHGFVLRKHNNQLVEQSLNGKRKSLGRPLPAADFVDAVAGPKGLVAYSYKLDDQTELMAYGRWKRPGHYRQLAPALDQPVLCTSVSQFAVGCEGTEEGDTARPPIFTVIPLSGGAPRTVGGGGSGDPPRSRLYTGINTALAGRTMLWQADPALVSMSAAHPTLRVGSRNLGETQYAFGARSYDPYATIHRLSWAVVSAYGGVAMLNDQHTRVVLAHSAKDTHSLFRMPPTDH